MLRDVNETAAYVRSDPTPPVVRGGLGYFLAYDGFGRGLWRTDGTREGTLRLALLDPEIDGIDVGPLLDGYVYIAVLNNFPQTRQVWRSDGTPAGTGPVTERPLDPVHVTEWNGVTYFFDLATDRSQGGLRTLWRSDGGTLQELSTAGGFNPEAPAGVGTWLLFEAFTGANGVELWRSDGTRQGTRRLADLRPGVSDSFPHGFTSFEGRVYFFASGGRGDDAYPRLWRSDGTVPGTVPISDQYFGSARSLRAAAGLLWIEDYANNIPTLWRSDGTADGTFPLISWPSSQIALDGVLYFLVGPLPGSPFPAQSAELWRSDGTVSGTTRLRTFRTSRTGYGCDDWDPAVIDGALVFLLDNLFGCEPVRFDPRSDTLTKLMPPPVRDNPPEAEGLVALDGERAVFIGDLPGFVEPQLWVTDATRDGTHLLHEIFAATVGSRPGPFVTVSDGLLFTAIDAEHDREVWRSDGTATGTVRISDGFPDLYFPPSTAAVAGGALLYTADPIELWFAPGSGGAATPIASFGTLGGGDYALRVAGGRAYFRPERDALWASDGTAAGTARVATGVNPFLSEQTAALGDLLFFVDEPYRCLWRTDGTMAGTWSLRAADVSDVRELTAGADAVVFRARSDDGGEELWRSDGTEAGTSRIADLRAGSEGSYPRNLSAAGATVYFDADDGVVGRELWRTDGRQATLVADLRPGPESAIGFDSGASGQATFHHRGILYFRAYADGESGLWRSDGTADGTFRLKPSTFARNFVAVDDALFFSDFGCEGGLGIFQSNRAATAVRCVLRLDAPASLFNQSEFDISAVAASDGVLFFTAYDPHTGTEPWAVPIAALFCRGDADSDRRVAIDELVRGVSAALGDVDAEATESFDGNGDGRIGIAELIAGVSAATGGCTSP